MRLTLQTFQVERIFSTNSRLGHSFAWYNEILGSSQLICQFRGVMSNKAIRSPWLTLAVSGIYCIRIDSAAENIELRKFKVAMKRAWSWNEYQLKIQKLQFLPLPVRPTSHIQVHLFSPLRPAYPRHAKHPLQHHELYDATNSEKYSFLASALH